MKRKLIKIVIAGPLYVLLLALDILAWLVSELMEWLHERILGRLLDWCNETQDCPR